MFSWLKQHFNRLTLADAGVIVDVSANPLDVRPVVQATLTELRRVSHSLRDTEQKIVLLLGEDHASPIQKMRHIGILKGVQDFLAHESKKDDQIKNFVFTTEIEHNDLEPRLERIYKLATPPHLRGKIQSTDRDGKRAITAYMASCAPEGAPVGLHTLLELCKSNNIKTRFVDASMTRTENGDFILDHNDNDTKAAIDILDKNKHKPIDGLSPNGMVIRNAIMIEKSLAFAKEHNAKIVVLQTGVSHIFGHYAQHSTFQGSLVTQIESQGHIAIPIVPIGTSGMKLKNIPVDARAAFSKSIAIPSTVEDCFDDKIYSAEAEHIRKIAFESELEIKPFVGGYDGTVDPTPESLALDQEIFDSYSSWLDDAQRAYDSEHSAEKTPPLSQFLL